MGVPPARWMVNLSWKKSNLKWMMTGGSPMKPPCHWDSLRPRSPGSSAFHLPGLRGGGRFHRYMARWLGGHDLWGWIDWVGGFSSPENGKTPIAGGLKTRGKSHRSKWVMTGGSPTLGNPQLAEFTAWELACNVVEFSNQPDDGVICFVFLH